MISKLIPGALVASGLLSAHAYGETWAIDAQKSSFTVHVFKSGLFSAFGDNHEVRATVASGSVSDGDQPAVEIEVDARQMTVLDPELAKEKRAEVQKRMLPLAFEVTGSKERFRGSATVRQRAFGIKPISAGGGTVNVKDEVKVDFKIVTARP